MSSFTADSPLPDRPLRCLIVEDDAAFASLLADVVHEEGGIALLAGNIRAARERMAQGGFDAVILDNHLPDGKGFDLYFELIRQDAALTIVVLTGLPELSQAVHLTRQGLFDYLAKPIDRQAFADCFRRIQTRLRYQKARLETTDLVAQSPAMREVTNALRQAAPHRTATVLLTGETGVGKDMVARVLHEWSVAGIQPEPPFVALNCASLSMEMFEAELFGAQRGAYTGADRSRAGLATSAGNGTLFLDEIAEVPLAVQSKLLRFLESREYRALGSTQTQHFKGRFVAATNRSLRDEVSKGRFREDLLYRLDVFSIYIPPLRDRIEEIPNLAENLLAHLGRKYDRSIPQIRPEDYRLLQQYRFPGNARELRNLLERSLLRTLPEAKWLALDLSWVNTPCAPESLPPPQPSPSNEAPLGVPALRPLTPLEHAEYRLIQQTLLQERGGIRRAAAKLGLTHQTLLRRLEKWPELRPKVG